MPSAADVLGLEARAYDLWRAPEVEELDGWLLRFAHSVTGRANSVWPNRAGERPLDQKIALAEDWYRRRGVSARYQLSPAARPSSLEAALAARGYAFRGTPVSVETADLADVLERTSGDAELQNELDDSWLALWTGARGLGDEATVRALLTGSPGPTRFARVGDVAVGRGVVIDGWLGITSMITLPAARRQGNAGSIVHALAVWAAGLDCTRVFLQVEADNVPARTLYARLGFLPSHEYRYCVEP